MRVLVDAICVRVLCRENLLVAIGNQLLLFYLSSDGETHKKCAPLPRLVDKIHGIDKCLIGDGEYLIVFHAGRESYSLTLNCNTQEFSSECSRIVIPEETCNHPVPYVRRRANDWISTISLLSPSQLCIVTSHGVAVLLHRREKSKSLNWSLVEKCACEDGSTLYCSSLIGQNWEQVLCFSGTALGLLLVWPVSGSNDVRGKVLRSISAHNGVIFSIACSLTSGLLTTTSDDRSIKFWRLKLTPSSQKDGPTVTLREERYCFAHTARVFQCRIITNEHRTLIASIGEDAYLCLWDVGGNLLLKKRLDDGPTLWSMDYDVETSTIFVTASNGNLHKFCIQHWMEEGSPSPALAPSNWLDIGPELPTNEHVSKVRFSPTGSVIAVTNRNHVMMVDNNGSLVCMLDRLEQFQCSIIEVGRCFLYLAGGCRINLYEISTQGLSCLHTGKTVSFTDKAFHCNSEENLREGIIRSLNYCERSHTVAVCDAIGRCVVFDEKLNVILSYHRISRSAERWLTAFLVLDGTLLLAADRSGHLYLYDRKMLDAVFKLPHVHGKLGITSITVADGSEHTTTGYRLLTTGHDSHICEIFVHSANKTLTYLNSSKTAISWIDRTVCLRKRRFYLGFNDAYFMMADDRNEMYTQFDCGGGHRQWDYHHDELSDTFYFVFVQHKRVKRMQYTDERDVGSALCLPRYNWHTRACNALYVTCCRDSPVVVSGGEDNILRLNILVDGQMLEEPRKYVSSHISSIKTILVKEQTEFDRLIIVSAGGRAQICVTSLHLKSFLVKQECTYMLLETDSERSRWKTNRRTNFDPETKFMCAAFVGSDHIVFGCSDGFIRMYKLLCTDGQWSVALVCESFYGRCILKVVSVVLIGKPVFVTMATDGKLCFWDPAHVDEPLIRHRLHNSGVNSVDFKCIGSDKLQLATGGDDQVVTVSLFEATLVENALQIKIVHSLCEKYLHTAQVTGIKLIDGEKMITVGVDQRIYVTSFSGYSKLEMISATNTCVSDVKGLSFRDEDNQIIVYGCGIEILNVQVNTGSSFVS